MSYAKSLATEEKELGNLYNSLSIGKVVKSRGCCELVILLGWGEQCGILVKKPQSGADEMINAHYAASPEQMTRLVNSVFLNCNLRTGLYISFWEYFYIAFPVIGI